MEKLLKLAGKFLEKNPLLNEVELSDGINKVRAIRNAPFITNYQYPYQYSHQYVPYQP